MLQGVAKRKISNESVHIGGTPLQRQSVYFREEVHSLSKNFHLIGRQIPESESVTLLCLVVECRLLCFDQRSEILGF